MMFPANIWIRISARDRAAYRRASRMKHGFAARCITISTTLDEVTTTAEAVTYGRG